MSLSVISRTEAQSFTLNSGWNSFQVQTEIEWSQCAISFQDALYPVRSAIDNQFIGDKILYVNQEGGLSSVALPDANASESTLLVPGTKYWIKSNRQGLELMLLKSSMSLKTLSYSPPEKPLLSCEPESTSRTTLKASWSSSDIESITDYQYAIGTCEGCIDLSPWRSTGLRRSIERGGLKLELGRRYFISVRAENASGLGEYESCSILINEAINPYLRRQIEEGALIDEIAVPPSPLPPPGESRPSAELELSLLSSVPEVHVAASGINVLSQVPASDWAYGCSATSAAMMMGYYDRGSHPDMYTGPTDGGLYPLTNAIWGSGENPLSATHNGIDGRSGRGSVDDYWIAYGNTDTDPWITNGWSEHSYGEAVGDYMGTNQSTWNNSDGSTIFYYYPNGQPLYDYTGAEASYHRRDGNHGMRLFVEARGYTVISNFNQYIFPYNSNVEGFSFEDFQAEIDSGRPTLIQVQGHTMLGYGYDTSSSTIYIHDTWDHSEHTMTWGGTYGGMLHYGVGVIILEEPTSIATPTATSMATAMPTETPSATPTATATSGPSTTETCTPVPTATVTAVPTETESPIVTPANTNLPEASPTVESTMTPTQTATAFFDDLLPPVVRAFRGFAVHNKYGRIKYRLQEESGRSKERIRFYKGTRTVKSIRISMEPIPSDSIRRVRFRALLSRGSYRYCVRATDPAGNIGKRSCASYFLS